VTETLAFDLTARLRELLADRPATESDLRTLSEEADAWARALKAQIGGSERRLRELTADSASPLSEIAAELRRVETLRPELTELQSLLDELGRRARELRTEWLLRQAEATHTARPD
jgi:uncharacterized coiled-coil DUF342 family protein